MEKCASSAFVNDLNNNAVFQLSLASKELFHSNFLYWLAVSETKFFNKLLKNLNIEFTLDLSKHIVCREYNHFDFCICEKYEKYFAVALENDEKEDCEEESQSNNEECKGAKRVEMEVSDSSAGIGRVLLVLENKFKSIPTYAQLQEYENKIELCEIKESETKKGEKTLSCGKLGLNATAIWKHYSSLNPEDRKKAGYFKRNIDRNKKLLCADYYILLTLAQNFTDRESIETDAKWKIITYEKYANAIKNSSNIFTLGFSQKLIKRYQQFISGFSNEINTELKELDNLEEKEVSFIFKPNRFSQIRCNDIWQKVALHKVLEPLKNTFYNSWEIDLNGNLKHLQEICKNSVPPRYVALEVSMLHATGMLAGRRLLHKEYYIEVELQGNALCWGIGFYPDCRQNYIKDAKKDQEWKKDAKVCLEGLKQLLPQNLDIHFIQSDNSCENVLGRYQNKDKSGYYYWKTDVSKLSIKGVVELMNKLLTVDVSSFKLIKQ